MKKLVIIKILLIICLVSSIDSSMALNLSVIEKIKQYNLHNITSTYTTYFNPEDKNRVTNIKVAAQKINGTVVLPGQVFSFNKEVGPRTKERGFKSASEIVNGKLTPGIGGGICQLSSTLYNAILLADLEVVTRSNHSRPVSYVPLGRGATVYYNLIDFKFKNNTSTPLMIMAQMTRGQLTVSILGNYLEREVEIITTKPQVLKAKVKKIIDYNLEEGTTRILNSGRKGFKVTVKKVITTGKKIIETEIISTDIYPPQPKIIKYNPKE
ncbi:putative vancomycin resistance protein [Halobacteroides halobius DSM 5150]|uniref:Putative vancomycin resistance protein n=1 Tax=Halobacteroides halobius (strain ATCC 35273 / DSM 5150 / MD-1) TaxID=748449 RepID=L0K733_HALHC|nr:VanW family protein [Halobacteroides halobius]AGB40184.1 putative vancomycin resistance protein [Halobacteroides halobius DSM 5150]